MSNLIVGMATIQWLGSGIRLQISHFAPNKQAAPFNWMPTIDDTSKSLIKGAFKKNGGKVPYLEPSFDVYFDRFGRQL